jgi:hypothetical protein
MDKFKKGLKDAYHAVPKNADHAASTKNDLDSHLQKYPFLKSVEEKTGRTRVEVVGACV